MTVEEYAADLLASYGCDIYTYGGRFSQYVMDDLKKAFPDGMPQFTYIEVANAILAMSRPEPIVRPPYRMCWSNAHTCDSVPFDSFEAAKANAEDTLVNWIAEEMAEWKGENPTQEDIDRFNSMICDCYVEIMQYDPANDEYEVVWEPSGEDEIALGWVEIKTGGSGDE